MTDFRKIAMITALAVVMGSYAAPVQAQGLMQKLFPFLYEDEVPDSVPAQGGTVAPFYAAPVIGGTAEQGDEYRPADAVTGTAAQPGVDYKPEGAIEGGVALDQPHRQPAQVEAWASRMVTDSLNIDPARYEKHITGDSMAPGINRYMTPYAIEAFKAFMVKDNLLAALQSNDLQMRTFVTDTSRLLNQGAVQNRYRWLVETPATISFLPRGLTDYRGVQPKTQRLNIRLQVGRVDLGGDDGMMIETIEFIPVVQ